jgi:D-glycero-D-manno-heptose 1,7-bisphosphate phosphatase
MRPLTDAVPKAMVPFNGKPFLGHVTDQLREQGFEDVLLLLGYESQQFIDHFADGSDYGVRISHRVTAPADLTAARVADAADADLLDDTFFLLYCDNYWPFDFDHLWTHYTDKGASCQVTVYANRDGYSRSSVIVTDGMVDVFDRGRTTPGLQGVEISYAILDTATVVPLLPRDRQELLEVAVYPELAARGDLAAYWTEHRYYSVGGLRRLPLTSAFFQRDPAVILDRDGVLNVRAPKAQYITSPAEWRWLPGALTALKQLADAGWRVIVVSNQAGINRGVMTPADLDDITGLMRYEAMEAGGRIDGFYYCPHDWDEGCWCRKPAPGMLFQAQQDANLDLTQTFFIGDDERDIEAAAAAGAKGALVSPQRSLVDVVDDLLNNTLEDSTT